MSDPTTDATPLIEKVKGKAKKLAGNVVGNEALVHEGELHEKKAEHLETANRLDTEAAERADAADLDERARELDLEQQRIAAEEARAVREEGLEREREVEQARIDRDADAEKAAAEQHRSAAKQAAVRDEAKAAEDLAQQRRDAAALEVEAERKKEQAAALDEIANS